MNSQQVILVDKNDKFLGYESREVCHTGRGRRHRAFVTLIFNSKNEVLLQKRRHMLFDGFWDLTAISHPLHVSGKDESYQQASDRALKKEMGIRHAEVKKVGAFNYFAKDGKNCENEYCAILVGKYDGKYRANPSEVYESKWVSFEEFLGDMAKNPKKYASWTLLAAKNLKGFAKENEFKSMLKNFLEIFEVYSSNYFAQKIKNSSKYQKLITKFYEDFADFTTGGKRLRAFLVYLGFMLGSKDINLKQGKKVFPISLAVEILHSFLLMHDDVIDRSDMRRDKLTIHKRYEKIFGSHYGISQAIVLGDIACFEAFKLVNSSEFSPELRLVCQNKLSDVLLETAYGEALDVEYSYKRPKIADIMQIADLKTARYTFVGPLSLGGILSKCSSAQMKAIREFGLLVGIAFQIQDDFLGVFADEKTLGKSILSDMREGKNTLLIYKTRELVSASDRIVIDSVWGKQNASLADLERIKIIIKKCKADVWCEEQMQMLVEKAKKYVKLMTRDKKLEKVMVELADFMVNRSK